MTPPPDMPQRGRTTVPITDLATALARIAELEAFDVRKIMVDVVPGYDGMGQEVYAKSIAEVENLLTTLSERADEAEARAIALATSAEGEKP